jgi:small GTP-binding protein
MTIKIIIAGDGGSGKTTLLNAAKTGTFQQNTKMTIGIDFNILEIKYNDQNYPLQIWDLGGQDRFQFILPKFMKGAKGAIVVYDLTRPKSVDHIEEWINLIRNECANLPLILLGNKNDLIIEEERQQIESRIINSLQDLMEKYHIKHNIFISAKDSKSIIKAFESLMSII